MQVLVEASADLNEVDKDGCSPICKASTGGHVEVVRVLIGAHADVHQAKSDGASPLFMASKNGHGEVVAVLLGSTVDINHGRADGSTPAFVTSQNGHRQVLALLAEANADLEKASGNGATPVVAAAYQGHEAVLTELISHGVNISKPFHNRTPLDWAEVRQKGGCITLLKNTIERYREDNCSQNSEVVSAPSVPTATHDVDDQNVGPNDNGGLCFSSEQTRCLQHAFEESFRAFAVAVDSRLSVIESNLEGMNPKANRIAEVTVGQQEATSPDELKKSKNSRRKERRRRVKNKLAVQRHQLLSMRPLVDTYHVAQICCSELIGRVEKLEDSLAVHPEGLQTDMYGWAQAQLFDAMAANAFGHQSSYDHGVFSADALAKQCKAVNLIQRCWRRARERRLSLNIALDVTVQYRDSDGSLSEADKRNAANDFAHMPSVATWLIRRPPSCGVRSDQVGQETDSESEHSISDEALS